MEEAFTGSTKPITVPGSTACEACNGTGAEGAAEPVTCPTCAGMGKVRASQGFFTVERTCPTCGGRGQIIKNPCKDCAGAGRVRKDRTLNVNVPAGVETGTRIRLAGEGEAGLRGGPSGDLYIFIEVEAHPIFERDNQNLYCRIPVSMTTAALGGEGDDRVVSETADLWFHSMVLLARRGIPLRRVFAELARRHGERRAAG